MSALPLPADAQTAFEKRALEAERLIQELRAEIARVGAVVAAQNKPSAAAPAAAVVAAAPVVSIPGDYKEVVLEGLAKIQEASEEDARKIKQLSQEKEELEKQAAKHQYRINHLVNSLTAVQEQLAEAQKQQQ